MIGDVLTVAWKEWRELLQLGGSHRGGRFSLVILIGVFGVFLPLQSGAEWVQSPATVFYWGWVPLMLVSSAVADSFAGERERHTLETLLASRLPDSAILLGKMLAAVAYGWGLVIVMLALSLVTVNIAARSGPWLMFPWRFAVGAPLLALLGAGLAATAGVLVSLARADRAPGRPDAERRDPAARSSSRSSGSRPFRTPGRRRSAPRPCRSASMACCGLRPDCWRLLTSSLLAAAFARFRRARLVLD